MKAFIYSRVSTREQAESGVSLDVQEQDCRAWCEEQGLEVEIFTDAGVSGRRFDRPALQELLGRLSEASHLVVWKADRLARDNVDRGLILRECQKFGVTFVSVTQPELGVDSPEAELVTNLVGAVAQFESALLGDRVRAAQRRQVETGKLMSRPPYGYDDDWQIVSEEAETIRLIDELYLDGLGFMRIAQELNRREVRSPGGGEWWHTSVRDVVRRPIYAGVQRWGERRRTATGQLRSGGDTIEAAVDVPPIRTAERWDEITRQLERRSQRFGGPSTSTFAGLLSCDACGSKMSSSSYLLASGERVRLYRCTRHIAGRTCPANGTTHIREDRLLDALVADIAAIAGDGQLEVTIDDHDVDRVERELKDLDRRRNRMLEAFAAGSVELDELEEHTGRYRTRRELLERQLKPPETITVSYAEAVAALTEDFDGRRRWVHDHIEAITWDGKNLRVSWR